MRRLYPKQKKLLDMSNATKTHNNDMKFSLAEHNGYNT